MDEKLERLDQLESSLADLSVPTSKLQQLQKYLLDSSFFSDFTRSLSRFTKKISLLETRLNIIKESLLKFLKAVAVHIQQQGNVLQRVTARRVKETEEAKSRTVDLENQYKQFKLESNLTSKETLDWIQSEVRNLGETLGSSIETTNKAIKDRLDELMQIRPQAQELEETAQETVEEMHKFELVHQDGLLEAKTHSRKRQSISTRNSLDSTSIRDQLLEEVTSRLAGAVEDIRQRMDKDYQSLYSHYGSEVMLLRSEIQTIQERVKVGKKPAASLLHPDFQLVQMVSDAQKTVTNLSQYAERGLENVRDICASARDTLREAEAGKHSEGSVTLLQGARAQLDQCLEQFKSYETKNDSDLYGVQESLKKADVLFKQLLLFDETPERYRLLNSEVQRIRNVKAEYQAVKKNVVEKQQDIEDEIVRLSEIYYQLTHELEADPSEVELE